MGDDPDEGNETLLVTFQTDSTAVPTWIGVTERAIHAGKGCAAVE
jgi:hypothetical protein